jgi:pseudouridylate synthase
MYHRAMNTPTSQGIETGIRELLHMAPEVADAVASGRPVVALESTLISHGLPYPQNVQVALRAQNAVRESGAVPATVAIEGGRILVGLDEGMLEILATAKDVMKAARPSLSLAVASGGWAATTVSATMIVAYAAGIEVFATGGIGGVHHGALGIPGKPAVPTLDISSDLEELARTPVTVVCAGPKAILDVPATLEYLETRGVPVVAVGTDQLPGFWSRSSGIPAPASVPDLKAAASLVATHRMLGLGSAVLLCVPLPAVDEYPRADVVAAVDRAIADAEAAHVEGPALTPWLLARVAELTHGASVKANVALIVNDARFAGRLAVELAGHR